MDRCAAMLPFGRSPAPRMRAMRRSCILQGVQAWLANRHRQGSHGNVHENRLVGDGTDERVTASTMRNHDDDCLGLYILLVEITHHVNRGLPAKSRGRLRHHL